MATIALIGGKVNREKVNNSIEKKLISFLNKENPVVLFCPYAVADYEKAIIKFHKMMEGINCTIVDLYPKDIDTFEKYLIESDILYIGGGISDNLIKIFKDNKLDLVLKKHENENKIYIGNSAGAMLFANISMGDKDMFLDNFHSYNYKMVKGLSMLNISMCPHYQNEDLMIYNDEIKKYGLLSFGIEEDTCLVIKENKYFVIKDDKRMSVYKFDPLDNYKMEPLYEGEEYEDSRIRS